MFFIGSLRFVARLTAVNSEQENVMNDNTTDVDKTDEDTLTSTGSDEELEAAAGPQGGRGSLGTLCGISGFC
jgi:hypothetical protein